MRQPNRADDARPPRPSAPTTEVSSSILVSDLRRWVPGHVVGPADAGWDLARRAWNLHVDQHPAAVVEVGSVAAVTAAVRVAAEHGMAVSAQPRGHGATGALDGTVLLRTNGLDTLHVDRDARTARVAAGVRWQRLNESLTGTGLTSLPGSTGDTSVVGLTVGGGLSWFGRRYGLAANRVRAVELVDSDARHVRVTADADPELFWAVRGGGGDFGVVTALELDLMPATHVYGGRLIWPADHAERILAAFVEVTAAAPDELSVWAWLLNLPDLPHLPPPLRGRRTVAVDMTHLGTAIDAERLLRPLRAAAPATAGALGHVPLAGLGAIAAEPTEPTPLLDDAALLHGFDASAAAAVIDAADLERPSPLAVVELRHLGGALARPADGHGAISHVPEPYLMVCGGPVTDADAAAELDARIGRIRAALAGHVGDRTPPNFGHDAAGVYPPEVLDRLRRIKRERDPRGVVRSNRPVLTAAGPPSGPS
jgi:FAD/FMN-containing dehydrogenase